ncbi:uncharacterized protein LY89DRAFT_261223 [Mollisia scopiformis]|uniref:Uncharacterized protein n=1 Tax=Mollisia scopiformis TaxID=149040 RepID=A0A132BDC5_MOLSC|nr:uncharacterized protein LY89DRAFT_261223 [Mollisia scopiformis]KUJ10432.1 hypothetical protein LY89DRAFT_261223 [Mollisia scopiformis]
MKSDQVASHITSQDQRKPRSGGNLACTMPPEFDLNLLPSPLSPVPTLQHHLPPSPLPHLLYLASNDNLTTTATSQISTTTHSKAQQKSLSPSFNFYLHPSTSTKENPIELLKQISSLHTLQPSMPSMPSIHSLAQFSSNRYLPAQSISVSQSLSIRLFPVIDCPIPESQSQSQAQVPKQYG